MTSTARPAPTPATPARRRARRATPLDRAVARGLAALERPEAPYLVLLAGFLAAGLYLRLDRLGAQSLWFDEADVVMQAQSGLGALVRNLGAAGQNGPLYTLFLHAWTVLFGTGEVAVRLPSALAGAATIPLIYAVGRALHGPKLGLYAAGILAVAPYQQWYAQEAKMYALVVLASLASTLLFLLALREDRRVYWAGYVATTTVALYLHVTAALVLAAHLTYFALARRGDSHPRRRGWFAFAALTLPYLPLALWEVRFVLGDSTTWHRPIAPLDFLRVSFTKFAVNRADPATESRARWLYLGLALLGALPVAWRHAPWPRPALSPRRRAALLALLLALPLALFYAVTLIRPLFSDRYLIVATPALYLLVAGGVLVIERFARALAPLALVALLATAWVPLRDVNLAAQSEKEDWRGAYAVVAEHLHPRDLVLVHPGYLVSTLDYYRPRQPDGGPRSLRDVPALTIPAEDTAGADERQRALLDLYLQEHTAGFERVWLVLSTDPSRLGVADPQDQVRDWYRYNGRLIYERQFNGVWLGLYAYSGPFRTAYYPPVPVRLDVAFGGRLTLVGYGYDYFPGESGVRAGDHVPLVLRWIFPNPDVGLYAIRWHLLDAGGHEAASGSEPLLGHFPLRPWERPGDVWDYHDLALPATLQPGSYRLAIECVPADGAADPLPATRAGEPLPGDGVPLGWIEVRR